VLDGVVAKIVAKNYDCGGDVAKIVAKGYSTVI